MLGTQASPLPTPHQSKAQPGTSTRLESLGHICGQRSRVKRASAQLPSGGSAASDPPFWDGSGNLQK